MESHLEESQRWMVKACSSLTAAKKLLEESLFAESISRSYCVMFYAAKALLLLDGIDVSKHSAVAAAFRREYARKGKIDRRYHRMLLDAFEWR
ncbi:MAG: HEPN domain-containing protein, partial [Anaerolineae bacterium]